MERIGRIPIADRTNGSAGAADGCKNSAI